MKTSQEEPSFIQELPEVVIKKPEIVVPVETSVIDVPKTERPPQKDNENSSVMHQEQIELMLNSKRSVSNAWSEISKSSTKGIQSYDSLAFQNGPDAWTAKQFGNTMLPRRLFSGESRRPTSSMAGEGSWQSDSNASKSKRY